MGICSYSTDTTSMKSVDSAEIFCGIGGMLMDPCVLRHCDTIDIINFGIIEEMSDAAARLPKWYGKRQLNLNFPVDSVGKRIESKVLASKLNR